MGYLQDLYYRDSGQSTGLAVILKQNYEHVQLFSSFAKIRVDHAA